MREGKTAVDIPEFRVLEHIEDRQEFLHLLGYRYLYRTSFVNDARTNRREGEKENVPPVPVPGLTKLAFKHWVGSDLNDVM